jgi:hypothetical protein
MIFAKISIGIFLLRVTVRPIHHYIIYTVMGATCVISTVFFFLSIFQCSPVSYFWNRSIPGGSCINIDVIIGIAYLYSGVAALCDFTFGLLPVVMIMNLNMPMKTKILLAPILSMACVYVCPMLNTRNPTLTVNHRASTAVVVRMAYIMDFKKPDFLYDTVNIAIWSDIEQGLVITAASLATLRPLYRTVTESLNLSHSAEKVPSTAPPSRQWYRQPPSNPQPEPEEEKPLSFITSHTDAQLEPPPNLERDDASTIRNMRRDLAREFDGFNSWLIVSPSQENIQRKPPMNKISRQIDVHLERKY